MKAGEETSKPAMGRAPRKPSASPPYEGPDRRRYPRHTVQVPIELEIEGCETPIRTETTDLSRNGCYLRLLNPLPVGLWIEATLWLDGVRIEIGGRVVTRHPNFGNGIMFLRVYAHDERTLAAYLDAVIAESAV